MITARDFTQSLTGEWHGNQGQAPCPVCQPERRRDQRALSVRDGNTRLLVHCHKSRCSAREILGQAPDVVGPLTVKVPTHNHRSAAAQRVWDQAKPIVGSIAERYLRNRGITCELPPTLRFHPDCAHGPTQTRHPAMIAKIESGGACGVHRTFLRPDGSGKAGLKGGDKLMLGSARGGSVRMPNLSGPLVVSEGIETALSLCSGLLCAPATVWAALSASGMRSLILPETPGRLTIATDGDAAGREAGQCLADRAHALGWAVSLLPAPEGRDWNDILRKNGGAA